MKEREEHRRAAYNLEIDLGHWNTDEKHNRVVKAQHQKPLARSHGNPSHHALPMDGLQQNPNVVSLHMTNIFLSGSRRLTDQTSASYDSWWVAQNFRNLQRRKELSECPRPCACGCGFSGGLPLIGSDGRFTRECGYRTLHRP